MRPILFDLGPLTVYSYGVFAVLGFGVAVLVAYALAGQARLPRKHIGDCALAAVLGGLAGARAWYLLIRPDEAGSFWNWLAIGGGRLALAGGIVGALAGLLYMLHRRRGSAQHVSVWQWLDIAAIAALAGLAVGRIGSHLNGDFLGTATSLPWSVTYGSQSGLAVQGEGAHPLAIYAAVLYAASAVYAYRLWKLGAGKAKPGLVFWSAIFLLGSVQVVLEAWHLPGEALQIGGIRSAVLTGLVLIGASLYFLTRRYRVGLPK